MYNVHAFYYKKKNNNGEEVSMKSTLPCHLCAI